MTSLHIAMATIRAEGCRAPLRVAQLSDGRYVVGVDMLSLKFGFLKDSIYLEEEIFDDHGELSYTLTVEPGFEDDRKVWILSPASYRALGIESIGVPCRLPSVVGSNPGSEIPVLRDVKLENPDIIHIEDSGQR